MPIIPFCKVTEKTDGGVELKNELHSALLVKKREGGGGILNA